MRSDRRAPRVISRRTRLSPWVTLVEKEVSRKGSKQPAIYHSFALHDYVAILARTENGTFPLVRQFRPAVNAYTWELPAGLIDNGQSPEQAARAELKEEAGLDPVELIPLGVYYTDTGRLENRLFAFFAATGPSDKDFEPEEGLEVKFFSSEALWRLVKDGLFIHGLHLALLSVYEVLMDKRI